MILLIGFALRDGEDGESEPEEPSNSTRFPISLDRVQRSRSVPCGAGSGEHRDLRDTLNTPELSPKLRPGKIHSTNRVRVTIPAVLDTTDHGPRLAAVVMPDISSYSYRRDVVQWVGA
jgi:hypothetical protein